MDKDVQKTVDELIEQNRKATSALYDVDEKKEDEEVDPVERRLKQNRRDREESSP